MAPATVDSKADTRVVLLSLGIVLLELCFGETLVEQPFRNAWLAPDGKAFECTDEWIAKEWQKQVEGNSGS